MSDGAVEIVRRMLELFFSMELDASWEHWAEDSTAVMPANWPEQGPFESRAQLREFLASWDVAFGPNWPTTATLDELEELPDGRVLARYSFSPVGATSGVPAAFGQASTIYTVESGKIVHGHYFGLDAPA